MCVDGPGTNEDCPTEGSFGVNVLAQPAYERYEFRLPYGRWPTWFDDLLGLKLSGASAWHCVERVVKAGRDEYESIREQLPEADVVHVDEITVSPDGEQAWLWTFITEGIRYEIATSRGSDVLEAVLGEDSDRRLVNDGWTAYPAFTDAFQRCWVHTFRVIDCLAERHPEAEGIATMHHNLYDWLLDLQEADPSDETRARMRENAH